MPEKSRYDPGTPSWVDRGTPDVEASAAFHGAAFYVIALNPDAAS